MSNLMQEYVQREPRIINDVFHQDVKPLLDWAKENMAAKRVRLIGSGSSFFMANAAKPLFEKLSKKEVIVQLPTDAEASPFPFAGEEAMLLISQEGKSVNTYGVAQYLRSRGFSFSLLTALPDSPTAKLAKHILCLACGEEKSGPKTIGVLSTYVMLARLAIVLGYVQGTLSQAEHDAELACLSNSIQALDENIKRCQRWYVSAAEPFRQAPVVFILSSHDTKPMADEAALKLVETIYCPSCAYEVEEFIHGPHCLLGTKALLIGLLNGDNDDERIESLCAFGEAHGMSVLRISTGNEMNLPNIALNGMTRYPIHLLLPFQTIAAWLSEDEGHDLDRPKFAGFATRFGSKLF